MLKLIRELFSLMFLEGYERFSVKRYRRAVKAYFQRLTRGWDDGDTYSLDCTITEFVLPRLKRFKELNFGFPYGLTEESWDEILDKMILAFEIHEKSLEKISGEEIEKMKEGLELFGKYYTNLWW